MTQYDTLNGKLSNSKLNKLKSAIKNATEVTLNLLLNVVGESNDEINFCHKLSLTNTQVLCLRKGFENGPSANIKLSKIYLAKMVHLGRGFFTSGSLKLIEVLLPDSCAKEFI